MAPKIHLYSDTPGGYEKPIWKAYDLKLDTGVAWGAKYDDVIRIYGKPGATGDLHSAPIPSRWIAYDGIMFDFVIAEDKLFKANISYYAPKETEPDPTPTPWKKPPRRPRSSDRPKYR